MVQNPIETEVSARSIALEAAPERHSELLLGQDASVSGYVGVEPCVDGIGEIHFRLGIQLRLQRILLVAWPDHERLLQLVETSAHAGCWGADVVGHRGDVDRRTQAFRNPLQERGGPCPRPVGAPERVAVHDVDQPPNQRRGNLAGGQVARHGRREAAGEQVCLPPIDQNVQHGARACAASANRRGVRSAARSGPRPAQTGSSASRRMKVRNPIGSSTRSGSQAVPRLPASAFTDAVRSAADEP